MKFSQKYFCSQNFENKFESSKNCELCSQSGNTAAAVGNQIAGKTRIPPAHERKKNK